MTESRDPSDSIGDIPFPDDDLPAREPGSDDDTPMSDEAVEFFRLPDVQLGYLLGTGWLTMGMVLSLPILAAGIGFGIRGGILANWAADFGFTGGTKAQCSSYFAPSEIHCFNVTFCFAESVLCDSAGGIRSSASVAVMRSISICGPSLISSSRTSSRRSPLRLFLSGPWQ